MATTEERLEEAAASATEETVEQEAVGAPEAEAGGPSGEGPVSGEPGAEEGEAPRNLVRLGLIAGAGTLAAAVTTGGIFAGSAPRVYATVAGVLGILIGLRAGRIRRASLMNAAIVLGLVLTGALMVLPSGFDNVVNLARELREAATQGDVLRPPVPFVPGWRAILGWVIGGAGFAAAWAAVELRRPALALLVPIPLVAISAISVPESEQLATGLAALVLFALGLGILSGLQQQGDGEGFSMAYEMRRAARALPLVGAITAVLVLLAQTNFLFPDPLYDPAEDAKKPETVPIEEVEDRVLFRVDSSVTGPWKTGTLDVYDGEDWRLPPFADTRFSEVPRSGVVDSELDASVEAEIEIAGLTGVVLPGLPNLVGVQARGPKILYDRRTGGLRLDEGQVERGLTYSAFAADRPSVSDLVSLGTVRPPDEVSSYLEMPAPPPGVQDLLDQAPTSSTWERLDFVRQRLLTTVTAKGAGQPESVPPERVDDMLFGSQEGTPYEIVAAQAMLARWAGVPARIGYGFDGGEETDDGVLEVRPKHGASWLEVYFPGFQWLAIVQDPIKAQSSFSDTQQQQSDVEASREVAVQLFLPTVLPPESQLIDQVRTVVLIVGSIAAVLLFLYYTWPAVRKAYRRSKRRSWAQEAGPEARIAVAYAEWRDHCTDFGYRYPSDTPLMFLERVASDEEHVELAWLVTRTLWGDLREEVTVDDAMAAEELSRSLRRRLSLAQPWTLRAIGAISRLSLREPYAPDLGTPLPAPRRKEVVHAA